MTNLLAIILESTNLDQIVELSYSQFNPPCFIELFDSKVDPTSKKQKIDGKKPKKKSYDSIRNFQIKWTTRLPWAEGLMLDGGFIHIITCRVCSLIENKYKMIGYKWDTLTKHQGCRIVAWDLPKLRVKKGEEFIAKDYAHLQNMKLYAQRGPKSVLVQVTQHVGEASRKIIQMKTLFHILAHGRIH
jgi:hypothetical protein